MRKARRLNRLVQVERRREEGEVESKVKAKTRRKKAELRKPDRLDRKDSPRDILKVNHPKHEDLEEEVEAVLLLLLRPHLLLEEVKLGSF